VGKLDGNFDGNVESPDRRAGGRCNGLLTPTARTLVVMERRASHALLVTAAAAGLIAMGLANGGLSPVAWNWVTIVSGVACATAVLMLGASLNVMALITLGGLVAFEVVTAVSLLWTSNHTGGADDVQRTLAYLSAALAGGLLASVRPQAVRDAVLAATAALSAYAVVVHLFPDVFGVHNDRFVPGRLYFPVGNWNAQALLAVIALLLLADEAANGTALIRRCGAAALLPWPAAVCILTLSRGAEAMLVVGVAVWLVLTPRRMRTSVWLLALGCPAAVAALLADRTGSMFGAGYGTASAGDGHRLAAELVALSLVLGSVALGLVRYEDRVHPGRGVRIAYTAVFAALALAVLAGASARYGSPTSWPRRAHDAFSAPASTNRDPSRLLSLSLNGRSELWAVAWHQARSRPLTGEGAGSYAVAWNRDRPLSFPSDSANNIYLETLAEKGAIGLFVLLCALLPPAVSGIRARRQPHAPAVMAVYCAFLVHAGIDVDWMIPAVTVPALWCGLWLTAVDPGARTVAAGGRRRWALAAIAAALAAAGALALVGNHAMAESVTADRSGDAGQALAEARTASRWQPWSYRPWLEIGRAEQQLGDGARALAAYRRATQKDGQVWETWFALSFAATDGERGAALRRAHQLNPLDLDIVVACLGHRLPYDNAGQRAQRQRAIREACSARIAG
jgi:hypothetical protein